VLALTLAAPGPVIGMALVLAYRDLRLIYDSAMMIVLAECARALPYAILVLWPFLRSFPREHLEAAAVDGLGGWGRVLAVALPSTVGPLLAAWLVAVVIGLSELPATNLAAPPGTPPLSVLIWGLLHTGVESHLAGVALVVLAATTALGAGALVLVWAAARQARATQAEA